MSTTFSKRHGYNQLQEQEITIREDAPHEFRGVLVTLCYDCGFAPSSLLRIACSALKKREQGNWSEYPNIDREVRDLIDTCDWWRVYDIIEAIVHIMNDAPYSYDLNKFTHELNDYFLENGIGWQLISDKIETRGANGLEDVIKRATEVLKSSGLNSAYQELHEARLDLSRRPAPDVTGAIQHSMAALECVMRQVTGNEKATLGDLMKHYHGIIPTPLDSVVSKAWGYASEKARHRREGEYPAYNDAELIVGLSATLVVYLLGCKKS